MKKQTTRTIGLLPLALCILTAAGLLLAACSPQSTPTTVAPTSLSGSGSANSAANGSSSAASSPSAANGSSNAATFTDPFAYCTAVGTIDVPDARYTGPKVPDSVINGFKKAANLQDSTMPQEMFQKSTFWRCMDKQVYVCNVGANIPCESKANQSKTPTQAMNDYCKENPSADFIGAAVTGHDTIYTWKCVNGAAQVDKQVGTVDAAGYEAEFWYKISQ